MAVLLTGTSSLYAGPVAFDARISFCGRAHSGPVFNDSDVAMLHSAPLIARSPGATLFDQPYVSWTSMSNQSYSLHVLA